MKEDDEVSIDYNHYIIYYNYKVAIIDVINNLDNVEHIKIFKDNVKEELKKNYRNLIDNLKSYQIIIGEKIIKKGIVYFIRKEHHLDFLELDIELNELISKNIETKI